MPEPLPTPFDIIDPLAPPLEVPMLIWILAPFALALIFCGVAWLRVRQDKKSIGQLPVPALITELSQTYDRFRTTRNREQIHLFVKLVRRESHLLSENAQSLLAQLEQVRFASESPDEAEFPMRELLSILSTRDIRQDGGPL